MLVTGDQVTWKDFKSIPFLNCINKCILLSIAHDLWKTF